MSQLLRVLPGEPRRAELVDSTLMADESFREVDHLEAWIVDNPQVLGDDLMVVSTQFNRWESQVGTAAERLDVLALSSSGQTVVIELKRGRDATVHLQALTYAALVSGFTREVLASTYQEWLARRGEEITQEEAFGRLKGWVGEEWTDQMLAIPRVIIVAESFPPQVITSVQWLSSVTSDLVIEAHEYRLFRSGGEVVVVFQRLFPVVDISDQVLRPRLDRSEVNEKMERNRRRAKSVAVIHASGQVADGTPVVLDLTGQAKPHAREAIQRWMAENPARSEVTWINHPTSPLHWCRPEDEVAVQWTPTALRNEFAERAGVVKQTASAADAWKIGGRSLYDLANEIIAQNGG